MPASPGTPLPLLGRTRIFAIVGDPIAQVGSPRLFNSAFRRRAFEGVLVPLHVSSMDLPSIVGAFRRTRNFDGLVVTVPHKITAMALVDQIGPKAEKIGAINAIRKTADGSLYADNFDGIGCVNAFPDAGREIAGKMAFIIGAGGAGRAIAHAIAEMGPAKLRVFDIDEGRATYLLHDLKQWHPDLDVATMRPDPTNCGIVVNCTSVGMRPEDPFPIEVDRLQPGTIVFDIILKPETTPLLRAAAERGCVCLRGTSMLESQVDEICGFFNLPQAFPETTGFKADEC